MKCSYETEIMSYAEGALSAERAQEAKKHMESCGSCKRLYGMLLAAERFAGSELPFEADVMHKISGKIDNERYKEKNPRLGKLFVLAGRCARNMEFALKPLAVLSSVCIIILLMTLGDWRFTDIFGNKASDGFKSDSGIVSGKTVQSFDFESIRMLDEKTGWAMAGDRILRTADGGLTWKDVMPDSVKIGSKAEGTMQQYLTCFLDGYNAWLAYDEGTEGKNTIAVVFTNDGGKSWGKSSFDTEETVGFNAAMDFTDLGTGWIMTTSSPALGLMSKTIYRTSDGGRTWYRLSDITGMVSGYPDGMAFRNSLDGWISCTNHGQDYIPIYRTNDGGSSWTRQDLSVPQQFRDGYYSNAYAPVFSGKEKEYGVLLVDFIKEGRRVVGVYITSDGGNTWDYSKTITGVKAAFADASCGWYVEAGENRLFVTADGGMNWEAVVPDIDIQAAQDIAFTSAGHGWAILEGKLYKTVDRGKSWKVVSS